MLGKLKILGRPPYAFKALSGKRAATPAGFELHTRLRFTLLPDGITHMH